jgi:hypothetical protein
VVDYCAVDLEGAGHVGLASEKLDEALGAVHRVNVARQIWFDKSDAPNGTPPVVAAVSRAAQSLHDERALFVRELVRGALTLALTVALVAAIKLAHDFLEERNARLIDRYMEIVGRIALRRGLAAGHRAALDPLVLTV